MSNAKLQVILDETQKTRRILMSDDGTTGLCFDVAQIKNALYGNGKDGICKKIEEIDGERKQLKGAMALLAFLIVVLQAIGGYFAKGHR